MQEFTIYTMEQGEDQITFAAAPGVKRQKGWARQGTMQARFQEDIVVLVKGQWCRRCGYLWIPRGDVRQCPRCKSARWDSERKTA